MLIERNGVLDSIPGRWCEVEDGSPEPVTDPVDFSMHTFYKGSSKVEEGYTDLSPGKAPTWFHGNCSVVTECCPGVQIPRYLSALLVGAFETHEFAIGFVFDSWQGETTFLDKPISWQFSCDSFITGHRWQARYTNEDASGAALTSNGVNAHSCEPLRVQLNGFVFLDGSFHNVNLYVRLPGDTWPF